MNTSLANAQLREQSVRASDGHTLTCHVFEPQGQPRGTVLVVQEIFGVNDHIRSVAAGYAAQGYRAIAPGMFDRRKPGVVLPYDDSGVAEGLKIARSLSWSESVLDLAAAASLAKGRVAAVGFCWGGTVAWVAAAREIGLSAAVAYYGGFIPKLVHERPRRPVMLHWAEHDHFVSQQDRQAMSESFPDVPQFTYDAEHGFNCSDRSAFDAEAAKLANGRTLAFLSQHIG